MRSAPGETPALEFEGLTHRYGRRVVALDGVSFAVPSGALCGLVGPNGAGKTTLLNIAATLLVPGGGSATVEGHDVVKERRRVRSIVGYMPDFFGVYEDMKVWEYLDYFGAAYRLSPEERGLRISGLLTLIDLAAKRNEYVHSLSRGMQQRLCLARTLIHDPRVLLLDEPAAGLDPRGRVELRELLAGLNAQGVTIFISSHVLADLADMCTHVVLLERGRLTAAGPLDELLRSARGVSRVRVRVLSDPTAARELLKAAPGVMAVDGTGDPFELSFEGDERDAAAVLASLVADGVTVSEFHAERDLEAAFLELTRGEVS